MLHPDVRNTVREWLAFRPALSHVFARHQVDLCSESEMSLEELCREKSLDPLLLLAELERLGRRANCELGADWAAAPISELCQHVAEMHHAYYERELPRLGELVQKVALSYPPGPPGTEELKEAFQRFRLQLESHIEREKQELFPSIQQLMARRPPAEPPDIAGLINSLERDHEAVDASLQRMRELTHGFVAPPGVCQTFQSLLDGLWELEMNLHQAVYEENRFLFPRAVRHKAALSAAGHARA